MVTISHTSRYSNTPGVSGSWFAGPKIYGENLHGQFTSAIQFENLEFHRLFSTEDSLRVSGLLGIYPKRTLGCDWLGKPPRLVHVQPKPSFVTGILGGDSTSQYIHISRICTETLFFFSCETCNVPDAISCRYNL